MSWHPSRTPWHDDYFCMETTTHIFFTKSTNQKCVLRSFNVGLWDLRIILSILECLLNLRLYCWYSLKFIGWMSVLIHTDYQIKSAFWKLRETLISQTALSDSALLHLPFSRELCTHTRNTHRVAPWQLASTELSYFSLLLLCLNGQMHT